jgi:hypothetical protein
VADLSASIALKLMHVYVATAGIGEYVQRTALRLVVSQTDPQD